MAGPGTTWAAARLLALAAAARGGLRVRQFATPASASSTWAAPTAPTAAAAIVSHFAAAPLAASEALVDALTPTQRGVLLRALRAREGSADGPSTPSSVPAATAAATAAAAAARLPITQHYADALFHAADTRRPYGGLDRGELADALRAHDAAAAAAAAAAQPAPAPLDARALAALAAAAGLPFIGFGFVDNFIMLTAGEGIEARFGVAFGLSTLAAAGLGNLLSDVAGLGLADQIEARARATRWGAPPLLSAADRARWSVRAARVAGSVGGVSVGCLLGMVPLLW